MIGNTIIKLREEKGYSRKTLAEKLDIPYTTLRNYETGEREPGHVFLRAISKEFNVSIDYILGITDVRAKNKKLSNDAFFIAQKYEKLDSHGKKMVDFVINEELKRIDETKENEITIGQFAAFGGGTHQIEYKKKEVIESDKARDQFHYESMSSFDDKE